VGKSGRFSENRLGPLARAALCPEQIASGAIDTRSIAAGSRVVDVKICGIWVGKETFDCAF
jgi:hypothetical protein